jgi:formate hydrogenlyase transcriptional activator
MSSADRGEPVGSQWYRHTWLQRYGGALIAVAAAALLSYGVEVAVGVIPPFILFYPTIMLVVLLGGFGPGVFATLLSAAIADYLFLKPRNLFAARNAGDLVWLASFLAMGVAISWVGDRFRRRAKKLQEVEKAVEGLEEMITVVDRNYHYVLANRAFLGYRGLNREQLIGHSLAEFMGADVFEMLKPKLDECFSGKVVKFEKRYKYPAMSERDFLVSYFPVEGSAGIDRVACILRDTTDQKESERSLKLFRTLIDQSNDAVEVIDAETLRFLDVNEKACQDLGYSREELLAMTAFDIDPNLDESTRTKVRERLREAGSVVLRGVHRRKDGSLFSVETSLRHVQLDRTYAVAISRNISDRKNAEDALRASEDQYRDLFEHSEDLVCTHDLEGRLLSVNPAAARLLGYEVDEFLKIPMREVIVPEYRGLFDEYLARMEAKGADKGLMCVMTRNGEIRTWEYNNSLRTEGVATPIVRGIARDVTEKRRAELGLLKSETRYRLLFEKNLAGVATCSFDGEVLDCNDAWARMLGYSTAEEVRGRRVTEFYYNTADRELVLERLRQEDVLLNREIQLRRKDGSPIWVLFNAAVLDGGDDGPSAVQATVIDISERRHAEEALRRNEERFRVALKDSPITVFSQDPDLRYTWIYNPQLPWQHDAIGKTDSELIGPKKARSLVELKRRAVEARAALREEIMIPSEGKMLAFDVAVEPLLDANGSVIGITGASVDIARLREMTDRLQDARDKLLQEKSYLEGEIQAELGFEEVVGQSPALREVLKNVRVVAPTDSTVLLLGETGTGKELMARSLHALSSRRGQSFIKLNCAAVPSGLLESELFGHERGAFTGAVNRKAGRIELADKGTLFLDEIGELPLELQPKLLRVLQDREFERLGGVRTLHVDVRIVCATNCDLRRDIADGKFREDLFYRLNVFPIDLPSLRERRSDIPILAHHFVRKHSARMGKHIEVIPDETITVLENWNWPGNIRELENMIERMVILSKGSVLAAPPVELDGPQEITEDNFTEMEREHIIRVLRETNGVLSGADGAASRLGIKRTTLQSMIKRFGIGVQDYRRGSGTFGPQ